jgi:hypothetical protein
MFFNTLIIGKNKFFHDKELELVFLGTFFAKKRAKGGFFCIQTKANQQEVFL